MKYLDDKAEVSTAIISMVGLVITTFITVTGVSTITKSEAEITAECVGSFSLINHSDNNCGKGLNSENIIEEKEKNEHEIILEENGEEKDKEGSTSENQKSDKTEDEVKNSIPESKPEPTPEYSPITEKKYAVVVDYDEIIDNSGKGDSKGKNKDKGNKGNNKNNKGCNSKNSSSLFPKGEPKGNSINRNFRGHYTCFIPFPPDAFHDWDLYNENIDPETGLVITRYHISYFNKTTRDEDRLAREMYCEKLGGEMLPKSDYSNTNECNIHSMVTIG